MVFLPQKLYGNELKVTCKITLFILLEKKSVLFLPLIWFTRQEMKNKNSKNFFECLNHFYFLLNLMTYAQNFYLLKIHLNLFEIPNK